MIISTTTSTPGPSQGGASGFAAGVPGPSAYEVWLSAGNTGTIGDYLEAMRGPPGESIRGDPGPISPVHIGTVNTGSPDLPADADITGVPPNQLLNLVIPQGHQGEPGVPGPAVSLTIGTITTLPAGSSATATIRGTPPSLTLDLGLPTGASGTAFNFRGSVANSAALPASGNTSGDAFITLDTEHIWSWGSGAWHDGGPFASLATFTPGTITTAAPGTSATVTITGTPPNYVLNLTVPGSPNVSASSGAGDAGKLVALDESGLIDDSFLNAATIARSTSHQKSWDEVIVAPQVLSQGERNADGQWSIFNWVDRLHESDIRNHIYTYDTTDDVNSAFDSGEWVFAPEGSYKLTDGLLLPNYGRFDGAGIGLTHFIVDAASYNMPDAGNVAAKRAQSIFAFQSITKFGGFSVDHIQPDSTDLSAMHIYPPAFGGYIQTQTVTIHGDGVHDTFLVGNGIQSIVTWAKATDAGGTPVALTTIPGQNPFGTFIKFGAMPPNGAARIVTMYGRASMACHGHDLQANAGWMALDLTGNTNGVFERIWSGTFGPTVMINGALNIPYLDKVFAYMNGMTANQQQAVYNNGRTSYDIGRVDGLDMASCSVFCGAVSFTDYGWGVPTGTVSNMSLDSNWSTVSMEAGRITMSASYGSKVGGNTWGTATPWPAASCQNFVTAPGTVPDNYSAPTYDPTALATNGFVPISNSELIHGQQVSVCQITITTNAFANGEGGASSFNCFGGVMILQGGKGTQFDTGSVGLTVTGGVCVVSSGFVAAPNDESLTAPLQNRTVPWAIQSGGGVLAWHASVSPHWWGTGPVVEFTQDNAGNYVNFEALRTINGSNPVVTTFPTLDTLGYYGPVAKHPGLANGSSANLKAGAGTFTIALEPGGSTALVGVAEGTPTIIWQSTSSFVTSSTPASGKIGVFYSGDGSHYAVKNNTGSTIIFNVVYNFPRPQP